MRGSAVFLLSHHPQLAVTKKRCVQMVLPLIIQSKETPKSPLLEKKYVKKYGLKNTVNTGINRRKQGRLQSVSLCSPNYNYCTKGILVYCM